MCAEGRLGAGAARIPPVRRGEAALVAALKRKGAPPGALIEEYRRALAASPDHETALAGLAEALLGAGAVEEADSVSARAVGKRPDSPRARLSGERSTRPRRNREARSEWEAARRLGPDTPYGREAEKLIQGKP